MIFLGCLVGLLCRPSQGRAIQHEGEPSQPLVVVPAGRGRAGEIATLGKAMRGAGQARRSPWSERHWLRPMPGCVVWLAPRPSGRPGSNPRAAADHRHAGTDKRAEGAGSAGSPPSKVDLRQYFSPIEDQGTLGSCTDRSPEDQELLGHRLGRRRLRSDPLRVHRARARGGLLGHPRRRVGEGRRLQPVADLDEVRRWRGRRGRHHGGKGWTWRSHKRTHQYAHNLSRFPSSSSTGGCQGVCLAGAWCSRLQAICRRGQGRARCNDRDLHDWGDTPKKGACGARNHVPTSRQRVVRIDGNRRWRR